jgi:hypothetical protein
VTGYSCLHVPLKGGAAVRALASWPTVVVVAAVAAGWWAWGPLLFIVPTVCVLAVIFVVRALRTRPAGRPAVDVTVTALNDPAAFCQTGCGRRADLNASALGRNVLLCRPCAPAAVPLIEQAATAAINAR